MKIISARNIGGSILGLLLLLGTMMVSGATTQAQYQYPNQDQYRRQSELDRQAEIQRQAEIDRQRQQRNGQWGNWQWNNGNRQGRRGRNSDGYPNFGGSYELRQTALNAGYNEGNPAGRNHRRNGRHNPTR